MADDDAATTEVDKWIRDNNDFLQAGRRRAEGRIEQTHHGTLRVGPQRLRRFSPAAPRFGARLPGLRQFSQRHRRGGGRVDQYENPASWTRRIPPSGTTSRIITANTVRSPMPSLINMPKAIELNPAEPIYYQNMATTVLSVPQGRAQVLQPSTKQQVFDKALALYRQAMKLDPDENFPARDRLRAAGLLRHQRPLRTNDALVAWTNAVC